VKVGLRYDHNIFDIIPINCLDKEIVKSKLYDIQKEKEIVFIVSSFPIDCDLKQYTVEDIISLRAIKELQEKIDIKATLVKMGDVLSENISSLNGPELFNDITYLLNSAEESLSIQIREDTLPGIILHIGFMIDRLKKGNCSVIYENKENFIEENINTYNSIKNSMEFFESKYNIRIPEDELCYLMNFFIYPN
jgi:transcriptional regulatory protein LevR